MLRAPPTFITLKVLIRTRGLILSLIPKIYLPLTHVTFGGKGPTAVRATKYVGDSLGLIALLAKGKIPL